MILGNCTARFQCDKFGKILSSVHTTADYKALNGRLITEKHFNAKTALPHTLRVNSPYSLIFGITLLDSGNEQLLNELSTLDSMVRKRKRKLT